MSPSDQNLNNAIADFLTHLSTGVAIPNARRTQAVESLLQFVPANVQYFSGTIELVGLSAGQNLVGFTDSATNITYSSVWPQAFFDLAKAALLNGKSLFILSNGLPYGSNLTTVLVFH